MTTDNVLDTVRTETDFEPETTRKVTDATLETLGERISDSLADELADELPTDLGDSLREARPDEAESFSVDEFVDRVRDRTGMDQANALTGIRSVFETLSETVDERTFGNAREQLTRGFDLLFEPGTNVSAEEFIDRIAERSPLESDEDVRETTNKTLATLGERISGGEAADVATYLPEPFDEVLTADASEAATTDARGEFVERIAERASIDEDRAEEYVRAVGAVLAEVVGREEYEKMRAQLPSGLRGLFQADLTSE